MSDAGEHGPAEIAGGTRRGLLLVLGLVLGLGALAATNVAGAAAPVDLGTADGFAVLAGAGVTNTGPSVINGDLGTCPTPAITGFPPGLVSGATHQADAAACAAETDLSVAYGDAAAQAPDTTFSVPTDLGSTTLTPGVYRSSTSFAITGTLTLDAQGDPNAVFVFQAGSTLVTAATSRVTLSNGAQACNVYWQVGSSATLGTASSFVGTILALTSITATTAAVVEGRLLAHDGATTLDSNVVTRPVCAVVPTTTSSTTTSSTTTSSTTTSTTTTVVPTTTSSTTTTSTTTTVVPTTTSSTTTTSTTTTTVLPTTTSSTTTTVVPTTTSSTTTTVVPTTTSSTTTTVVPTTTTSTTTTVVPTTTTSTTTTVVPTTTTSTTTTTVPRTTTTMPRNTTTVPRTTTTGPTTTTSTTTTSTTLPVIPTITLPSIPVPTSGVVIIIGGGTTTPTTTVRATTTTVRATTTTTVRATTTTTTTTTTVPTTTTTTRVAGGITATPGGASTTRPASGTVAAATLVRTGSSALGQVFVGFVVLFLGSLMVLWGRQPSSPLLDGTSARRSARPPDQTLD